MTHQTKHIADYPVPGGAVMCSNCGEQNYETVYCNKGDSDMSPKAGEEIFINGIETQILRVIGVGDPFIKEKEVIYILEALLKKLKGKI